MVAVSFYNKERIYYHLGYGVARLGLSTGSFGGISVYDLARVEAACDNVTSDLMHSKLLAQLNRCDRAEESIELIERGTKASISEVLIGDVNRTRETLDLRDVKEYRGEYEYQCNRLATMLNVTNYRDPSAQDFMNVRNADAYVASVPGVADTSTSSRAIEVYKHLHGSAGW